jgi:hypothetical protein
MKSRGNDQFFNDYPASMVNDYFEHYDKSFTYVVEKEKKMEAREIILEAEKLARSDVSGDKICILCFEQKLALDIYLTCYGLGHRCEVKSIDRNGNWYVILKLADVRGPFPNFSVFRNLQRKRNWKQCRVTAPPWDIFRFYSVLPKHVQFCAESRIYYDRETEMYFREPESTLNRRQSLRSHCENGISKHHVRYQRRYCPWNIKDNTYMY